MAEKNPTLGVTLAAIAGLSWGSMAVAAQYLFENFSFVSSDLVCGRLLGAGILLLAFVTLTQGSPWKGFTRKIIRDLFIYGVVLAAIQYTFFEAIRYTNAGVASMILAVGPAIILLYMHFFERKPLTVTEVSCVIIAFIGVVLLGSRGSIDVADFSVAGVLWAMASTVCGVIGTLYARHITEQIGPLSTVGWATFFAGTVMCLVYEPWGDAVLWTFESGFWYAYVIVVGTVVAFCCYLQSMRHVDASVTALVGGTEPLSGFILSAVILGVSFTNAEVIGAVLIMSAILWLSLYTQRKQ